MRQYGEWSVSVLTGILLAFVSNAYAALRIPESAHNLLVDAKISSNLASYDKGLRGQVNSHTVNYRWNQMCITLQTR